jgi:glycosyltransferase involved in cell wall biosynthesis
MPEYTSNDRTVALWGVFDALESAYSLAAVVVEQARMLARAGYDVGFFMQEDYEPAADPAMRALLAEYPGIWISRELPHIWGLVDYDDPTVPVAPEFWGQVARLEAGLEDAILTRRPRWIFTHDITFQSWFLPHNVAMRQVAKRLPGLEWLHWMHSAPSEPRPDAIHPHTARYVGMPGAKWIYLNHLDVPRMAAMRGLPESEIFVVPNARDICDFLEMDKETKGFIRSTGLLSAELVVATVGRICPGKQPEKAARIAAGLAAAGRRVKLLFINSYATNPEELELIEACKRAAEGDGLPRSELLFTTEWVNAEGARPWAHYAPARVVRELLAVSDVFVLPSASEACSLSVMEAALSRCLCVLNDDFPPMRELLFEHAIYGRFSSTLMRTEYQQPTGEGGAAAERQYYREFGCRIAAEAARDKALAAANRIRRAGAGDWVFSHHIEPVMYL